MLWHQVYNKPIFAPKEFLQTHSPERLEWLEWFIAIMRDLKTPYVVQSVYWRPRSVHWCLPEARNQIFAHYTTVIRKSH